jgi:hypothetical protein
VHIFILRDIQLLCYLVHGCINLKTRKFVSYSWHSIDRFLNDLVCLEIKLASNRREFIIFHGYSFGESCLNLCFFAQTKKENESSGEDGDINHS